MASKIQLFRVGKVAVYLRGKVWYLCYYEHGQRRRPRVGPDKELARQLAAQTNAQLEVCAPTALSFEPISIAELRERWLHYHEQVLRSSVATVQRYRTASAHLLNFTRQVQPVSQAAHFQVIHAEAFSAYLRRIRVSPNGHRNTAQRPLRDKGVKYILEVCRSLFNYAAKRRHLPPYAENPFSVIEIERIPIEDSKQYIGFDREQERQLMESCDDWQFAIFLTLLLTGVRPGELQHLLLPDDLDLDEGWLRIRNKPELGWRVKTRNERAIPLLPELVSVLRNTVKGRATGPVFLRRRSCEGNGPRLARMTPAGLSGELARRIDRGHAFERGGLSREEIQRIARKLWCEAGAVKTDQIRTEFMRLTRRIALPHVTAPKTLRHMFATALQDANVDPLIRNQLMGHTPAGSGTPSGGLAMTGVYTHSRPETIRRQLGEALRCRPSVAREACHNVRLPSVGLISGHFVLF